MRTPTLAATCCLAAAGLVSLLFHVEHSQDSWRQLLGQAWTPFRLEHAPAVVAPAAPAPPAIASTFPSSSPSHQSPAPERRPTDLAVPDQRLSGDRGGLVPASGAQALGTLPAATSLQWRSASRVQLPAIGLDSSVVPSRIVRVGDDSTWEVPAHRVGHGEASGSVGERGNVVLLGHLTSLREGQVFAQLHRAPLGATLTLHATHTPEAAAEESSFVYRVVRVWLVPRDDVSVLVPGDAPVVTLVTCAGTWLPRIQDYSHRLVVRGELISALKAPRSG